MKKILERYLNGLIWFEKNQTNKLIKYERFEAAQDLMAKLEDQLKQEGITPGQLDRIIYYGKWFHECFKTDKVTENVINYILKNLNVASK